LEKNEDHLSTPIEAYITFETEEAMLRALRLGRVEDKERDVKWNGSLLKFKSTSEPSNIKFSNLYQSSRSLLFKKTVVLFGLLAFLMLICFIIYEFMDNANKLNIIFPQIDCNEVTSESSPDMIKTYAMIEYFNFASSDKSEESFLKINTDNLQCF
jgi:hypothetical protein